MMCAVCGAPAGERARFCSQCGMALEAANVGPGNVGQGNVGQGRMTGGRIAADGTRLVRPRQGRVIAGVCEGFALRYGWDPIVVRLVAVLAVFMGVGMPLVVYVVAWVLMPNAPYALPLATGPITS